MPRPPDERAVAVLDQETVAGGGDPGLNARSTRRPAAVSDTRNSAFAQLRRDRRIWMTKIRIAMTK